MARASNDDEDSEESESELLKRPRCTKCCEKKIGCNRPKDGSKCQNCGPDEVCVPETLKPSKRGKAPIYGKTTGKVAKAIRGKGRKAAATAKSTKAAKKSPDASKKSGSKDKK